MGTAENKPDQTKRLTQSTRTVVKGIRRRVEKDSGPVPKEGYSKSKYQKEMVKGGHMEMDGDVRKWDQVRLLRSMTKIKEWWNRVFGRKLEIWRMKNRRSTWGDEERFIKLMFNNGVYETMMEQMAEDLLDDFPPGGPTQVITKKELEKYLIKGALRNFTKSNW